MSMFLIGEARKLISKERSYKDQNWTEYNLKVELENGQDVYLQVPKNLNTKENIEYLSSLKGQDIQVAFWLSHRERFLTYYLSELPQIKE